MKPVAKYWNVLFLFSVLCCCCTAVGAVENVTVVSEKTLTEPGSSWGNAILQTTDGYVIAGGQYNSTDASTTDLLIWTDAWSRSLDYSGNDLAAGVVEADAGYVLAGVTDSFGAGDYDALVVSLNPEGLQTWARAYGGEGTEWVRTIVSSPDGGYTFGGFTNSFGSGDFDAWIVALDSGGSERWNRTFGGPGDDGVIAIAPAPDGYVAAGFTGTPEGFVDGIVQKLDENGTEVWNRTFGGSKNKTINAIVPDTDGYIFAGEAESDNGIFSDAWVVKIDENGTEQWSATFGGDGVDAARSIARTPGGYAFAGTTNSSGSGSFDAWIVLLDSGGNETWNMTSGGAYSDEARSIIQTPGGLAITGVSVYSEGEELFDAALIVELDVTYRLP